ncbi:MAG TPA: hypothetical protein VG986_12605 [Pseudolabrys sp.]|nr:hypothetical protein [Pseudolabrys sp.]
MPWNWSRAAYKLARLVAKPAFPLAAFCALALAGCQENAPANVAAAQPRGATVSFESIDGLPTAQFHKLVADLNDEAQSRRLAVISREQPAVYRVRGYLAAGVEQGKTTISWVWDVFDGSQHRTLRIEGEEKAQSAPNDAWAVADDAMLRRIANNSMDQLAAFLTSPTAVPATSTVAGEPAIAFGPDRSTPEAAGIFRISHPQADPVSGQAAQTPATPAIDTGPARAPQLRPKQAALAGETLTLAAAARH